MVIKNKKISKIEEVFSGNQVMTLLESMNDGIVLLSENQSGLREEFIEFKGEMSEFKQETRQNFKKINSEIKEFKGEMSEFKQETRQNFKKINSELK